MKINTVFIDYELSILRALCDGESYYDFSPQEQDIIDNIRKKIENTLNNEGL